MRFNMLFCIQITHTRTEQSIYNHFKVETAQPQTSIEDIKNLKNMKGDYLCPLYNHLLRNGVLQY